MAITFNDWLEIQIRIQEPEPGFPIQAYVHEALAVFHEWKRGHLQASEARDILNIDTSDPEVGIVKTYLDTLSTAEMLELEMVNRLGAIEIPKYDLAYLRTRWGL